MCGKPAVFNTGKNTKEMATKLYHTQADPTDRREVPEAYAGDIVAVIGPKVAITQSLHDSGCDMVIEWAKTAKYGVQMKSYNDIADEGFAVRTLAKIQDSKQHGLNGLCVLRHGWDRKKVRHAE